jgi:hypothetical protein
MKTSNPYKANLPVKTPPETVNGEMAQARGKIKARYPSAPQTPSQNSSKTGQPDKTSHTLPGKNLGS